jgi:hypothetical protein
MAECCVCWCCRSQSLALMPLLKKPLEQVGKFVDVPGAYWSGNMSAEEVAAMYKCAVRDFSYAHDFPGVKHAAFQLQEMGPKGTGSLEHGDASGEIFWMRYPFPFLEYFYGTYPELLPKPAGTGAEPVIVDIRSPGNNTDAAKMKPDTHPDFPHIRLSTSAPVFKYYTINSDILQEMGPKSGLFCGEFECIVRGPDGSLCGCKRRIFHKRDKGVSSSNLIAHMRERALVCSVHAEAVKVIDAASKNVVDVDGESVMRAHHTEHTCHADCHRMLLPSPCLPSSFGREIRALEYRHNMHSRPSPFLYHRCWCTTSPRPSRITSI